MPLKDKLFIILSLIAITIITPTYNISAGCFGPEPIIDSNDINLECFTTEANSCTGAIEVENNCNQTFNYYPGGSCSIKDSSPQSNKEIIPEAKLLFHSDFIEIPADWRLEFYRGGIKYICKKDFYDNSKLYVHKCVEISCDKDKLESNTFSLEFGTNSKQYTIKGYYKERMKKNNNLNVFTIFFKISLLCMALFLLFKALLFFENYKAKS